MPKKGYDTDELIKLLTQLGTFSCPGHQELATQCKKRNPGGSMVFSRFLGSPENCKSDFIQYYSHHMHRDDVSKNGNHRLRERRSQMAANEEKNTTAKDPS